MAKHREKEDLFLLACARGLLEDISDLLAGGVPPGSVDADRRGGAHFAAARGELEVLQLLYSQGVDVDAEDNLGRAPLHYAALHDHESVIMFLARKAAWLDSCDGTDCSALHLAARGGAAAAAARLVKLGAKVKLRNNWELTAMGEAVCRGHAAVCTALVQAGYVIADDLAARVNGGFTILHLAAASGQVRCLAWLLACLGSAGRTSALINDAANPEHLSPLHCLVITGRFHSPGIEMMLKAGADVSLRDVHGRTPLSMIETANAGQELKDAITALDSQSLESIRTSLIPNESVGSLVGTEAVKPQQRPDPATAVDTTGAGHEPHADESLTVAARLQACTCPDHVAAILRSTPYIDRVHRVKLWAKLEPNCIEGLPGVSQRGKLCIMQVREVTRVVNRAHAEGCLRRDDRFQEAMQEPRVRRVVDAVIQDPQNGPLVRDQDALACLNKMRALRDVLSLSGQGQINLAEVLRPWDPQDTQREAGMLAAFDEKIDAAIEALCNPTFDEDRDIKDVAFSKEAETNAQRQAVSEIEFAPPRERRESGSMAGWESDVDGECDDSTLAGQQLPSLWQRTLQKVLQQIVVAVVVLAVFWKQGKLTYQLHRGEQNITDSTGP
eukprot:jgi/Ulvmu1/7360/UM036_0020.1